MQGFVDAIFSYAYLQVSINVLPVDYSHNYTDPQMECA